MSVSTLPVLPNKDKPAVMHLAWLDTVRAAASLYVVFHHAVMQIIIQGDHANDKFYRVIQLATSFGHYAVDIFIVLSGYCLMLPLVNKSKFGNTYTFYLRRTIRIVIPYYAAIVYSLILIYFFLGDKNGSHWASVCLPVTTEGILRHVFLIYQWWEDSAFTINSTFWSVGVEYQIYFLFPIFFYCGKEFGFGKTFIVVTTLSYLLLAISMSYGWPNPSAHGASFYYCALFFIGMTAAQYSTYQNTPLPKWLSVIKHHHSLFKYIVLVLLCAIAIGGFLYSEQFSLQVQSLFVGLCIGVLFYLKDSGHWVNSQLKINAWRGG